jgi:hypothetical protein
LTPASGRPHLARSSDPKPVSPVLPRETLQRVKLFLLTLHITFAAGVLWFAARRPDVVVAPGAILLVIIAATCTGIAQDRRWAAIPAGALGFGAAGTAVMLFTRGMAGGENLLRVVAPLAAVVLVELATTLYVLRRRVPRAREEPS